MHTFLDNAGRTWIIAINVATIKRVRGLVGIDLYGLVDEGFQALAALLDDPVRLADVLFCLCKDEADKASVSDEDFGRALAGDAIARAADAFVDELVDFFPDARTRASLRRVIEAGRQVRQRVLDQVEEALATIDPDREASALIASSGGSPVSLVSTPGPSPSESSS